ncbi:MULTISPECIES: hypothetical protein [unclassified Streptomyces]|uniref:hypothetical protein n=1 Tax=unclassified Streptomyces TaxID=2593676 RepID=UPI002887E491|nr:hypothetical protein [Streptomyces sp. DSM 41633]
MADRSRTQRQRLLMLSAAAALVAGGVLPSAPAFSDPAAAYAGAVTATPAEEWVKTTDPPSGITAELPGKAQVRKVSIPTAGGGTVEGRSYGLEVPEGAIGFTVHDIPGDQLSLDEAIRGLIAKYKQFGGAPLVSTDVRKKTVDGRRVIDARLSTVEHDQRLVGWVRVIADDDHLVQALTLGPESGEKTLKKMHERFVDSIHIP